MRVFIVCTILVFCGSAVAFGQKYQKSFYVEDRFKNEIEISPKALEALRQVERVRYCIDWYKNKNYKDLPYSSKWFRATEINLNNDAYPDLIVEQNTPCLSPPSRQPYWILINKGNRYDLVLTIETFGLYINKEKTKGHYNITIDWATSNTIFKTTYAFNGYNYKAIANIEKQPSY